MDDVSPCPDDARGVIGPRRDLVDRYRRWYGAPASLELDLEMVLRHWELERAARSVLLESTPEDRRQVFARCYSDLYGGLPWLNHLEDEDQARVRADLGRWARLVGRPPKRVYEVGSGSGRVAHHLAALGHRVTATEITVERGERLGATHANLRWEETDGVHLTRFALPGTYDVVIANQVIEHLHPTDLPLHLRESTRLLGPGGRYLVSTPNALVGPSDVSGVFGCEQPAGMHLREYTHTEIARLMRAAGFSSVAAPLRPPAGVARAIGPRVHPSAAYLAYLSALETLVGTLASARLRRAVGRAARVLLFAPNVLLVGRTAMSESPRP